MKLRSGATSNATKKEKAPYTKPTHKKKTPTKMSDQPNKPEDEVAPAPVPTTSHEEAPPARWEDNYVFFWKPDEPYGWASQWHPESFKGPSRLPEENGAQGESEEVVYNTAETWMMYHKAMLFDAEDVAKKILLTSDPKETKALGRSISNFDDEIWQARRYDVVLAGSLAKYRSSKECRDNLLATGDKQLVEGSPFDRIWGIGYTAKNAQANMHNWGLNLLGQALMEVRETLRNEASHK